MTKDNEKNRENMEPDPQDNGHSAAEGTVDSPEEELENSDAATDSEAAEGSGTGSVEDSGPEEAPLPEDDLAQEMVEEEGAREVSEVEVLTTELTRLRDQHLRLAADFENYRKRASTELTGNWTRARADLVRSLVEGLDDLQRVSQFTSEDTTVEALIEGVDLVERNFMKALTEAGLEVLDPVGERFDPNSMEAMMRVEAEEEGQDETVHQVFQKGYMFKDQLVRPARVSVYKDDD
jgi:molecular chaperone GrpE